MTDEQTIAWYDEAAAAYAGRFPRPTTDLAAFMARLPPGGAVLDLGCGGGRATAALVEAGFDTTGLDASAGLLEVARAAAPAARFIEGDFTALDAVAAYDGIWANFSLLHAPRAEMPAHLGRVARALKPGGAFHLGLILGEGAQRDRLGRFYTYYGASELPGLLRDAGFMLLDQTEGDSSSATGEAIRHIILLSRLA